MIVEAQVTINGSTAAIWNVITDIEHAAEIISGIEKIEIVEKPATGLIGLRWLETRIYFGSPATVEKRITEAVDNEYYKASAESDGFLFLSTMRISGSTLSTAHETKPQGFVARIKSTPMFLFKGVIRKALLQDLNDLKSAIEGK
jgi:hypothetical protein